MICRWGRTNYAGAADYESWSSVGALAAVKIPILIGIGGLDPPLFKDQAAGVAEAMCAAGRCPAAATFPGHSHMPEVYSIQTDERTVSDALLNFIRAHLN